MKITKIEYQNNSTNEFIFPATLFRGLMHVEGYPNALTDGFAADINASETDLKRKTKNKPVPKQVFESLLSLPKVLLSKPEYIVTYDREAGNDDVAKFDYFILMAPKKRTVGAQIKYYNYFSNKYPGCVFRQNENLDPIVVYKSLSDTITTDNIVGLIMPVIPAKIEEGDITIDIKNDNTKK